MGAIVKAAQCYRDNLLNRNILPIGVNRDGAVGAVVHPAGDVELPSEVVGGIAKSHVLHMAVEDTAQTGHACAPAAFGGRLCSISSSSTR